MYEPAMEDAVPVPVAVDERALLDDAEGVTAVVAEVEIFRHAVIVGREG